MREFTRLQWLQKAGVTAPHAIAVLMGFRINDLLGDAVALQSGYPSDGYYCVSSSGTLQRVSDYSAPPNNCSAAGNSGTTPAEYVQVQTSYTYAPLFTGLTVLTFLPTRITSIAWVRLH